MRDNPVVQYLRNSALELTKVTWPTKNQAVRLTVIVFVFCVITALFLTLVDYLFTLGFDFLTEEVAPQ